MEFCLEANFSLGPTYHLFNFCTCHEFSPGIKMCDTALNDMGHMKPVEHYI